MYYGNYIIIEIPIPDFEKIKKKYLDNNDTKIVLLNDKYTLMDPLEYFTPVMFTDRTGHSPWTDFWGGIGNWFKNTFSGFVNMGYSISKSVDEFFYGQEFGERIKKF